MILDRLNLATAEQAREALIECCGSERWADGIIAFRPINDARDLHEKAEAVWRSLAPEDWLEAFSRHPKIGAKSSARWSAEEQRGMSDANEDTAEAMGQLNTRYERKFGWIFLVCATGKSAEEMIALLEHRLFNDTQKELQIAAAEQAKIMHLRLDKLLAE